MQQQINQFDLCGGSLHFNVLCFVLQLCTGAGCGKVIQTFGWCKSFFGKVWGLFWYEMGVWGAGRRGGKGGGGGLGGFW